MRTVILLMSITVLSHSAVSQGQNYKAHTLFVHSYTRYVQWPEGYSTGDFTIKVLGSSPIMDPLSQMASERKVGDRSIKVSRINMASEIGLCNILIITKEQSASITDVLQKLGTKPTLIITEEPGMGKKGGDINFVVKENGSLGFELNQASVNKKGLKVSTELTRLAILI